jgi:hypothetical protein
MSFTFYVSVNLLSRLLYLLTFSFNMELVFLKADVEKRVLDLYILALFFTCMGRGTIYRPSDPRLSTKLVPTSAVRGASRSQRGGSAAISSQ